MKKILITILIILLVVLCILLTTKGIEIGNFEILSYYEIVEKNEGLDTKISEATRLTSVTFPEKVSSLKKASKELTTTREKYEDKVAYSSEEDVKRAREVKNYEVDFLLVRLGNYVNKHGIEMDLNSVSKPATNEYNLNFTLRGKYALIAEFIRDIENDSNLNFIIENFKLTPGNNNEILKAEFVVTDVKVNADENIKNTDNVQSTIQNTDTDANTTTNTDATQNTETTTQTNTNTNTTTSEENNSIQNTTNTVE